MHNIDDLERLKSIKFEVLINVTALRSSRSLNLTCMNVPGVANMDSIQSLNVRMC